MEWNCIGDENVAWKEGPYLSAGANAVEIDRTRPYCLMLSEEMSVVSGIVVGPAEDAKKEEHGGIRIPFLDAPTNPRFVEANVAKLAIIEQFELFKDFLETFDGPYNLKRCKKWSARMDTIYTERLEDVIKRRNELVHDSDSEKATMKEAIEYFYELVHLGPELQMIANDV